MSDNTRGAGRAEPDDTLIRPTQEFYGGEPPAAVPNSTTPAPPASTGSESAGRPTLAERIMHRLPAPPEKADVRKEYEERKATEQAEQQRAQETLRREEERKAAQAATIILPSAAAGPMGAAAAAGSMGAAAAAGSMGAAAAAGPARAAAAPGSPRGAGVVPTEPPRREAVPEIPSATASRGTVSDPEHPEVLASGRRPRRTRKARLRIARVDPWSVMKTFFLFSIAGGIMFFTAAVVVYTVVEGSGLFDRVDQLVKDILGQPQDDTPFQVKEILGWERVMGVTALLACVNVVILTALATLGSFLYNLAATMLGGLEVTLAED